MEKPSDGETLSAQIRRMFSVASDHEAGDGDTEDAPSPEGPANASVNLAAWAMGEEDHPFVKVAQAIKERFAFATTSREQALAFLADQGFTTADGGSHR